LPRMGCLRTCDVLLSVFSDNQQTVARGSRLLAAEG